MSTGAVLHSISLGITPTAVFPDERSGHLIVVDGGGEQKAVDPWNWVPSGLRSHLPFASGSSAPTRAVPGSVAVLDLRRLQ
jgi:hypothetical protein